MVTMTLFKVLRLVVAAALVLLGTSQGPADRSFPLGVPRTNFNGIWFVHGGTVDNDEDAVEDDFQSNDSDPARDESSMAPGGEAEPGDKPLTKKLSPFLRGTPAQKKFAAAPNMLEGIFEGLLGSMNPEDAEEAKEAVVDQTLDFERINRLLDTVFPPRLQTAPKYQGALECLNLELSKDILSGPNKKNRDVKALQRAYNFVRRPPEMLKVPAVFVELRAAADRHIWETERKGLALSYERRGEPIPGRLQLSADELVIRETEEPRVREEELSDEETQMRLRVINGWLKQQFRLRLYYRKRTGTLKGNPQDFLVTFDAGPNHLVVEIEDIEGLSYNAELDPEPVDDDTEVENFGGAAQRSEL